MDWRLLPAQRSKSRCHPHCHIKCLEKNPLNCPQSCPFRRGTQLSNHHPTITPRKSLSTHIGQLLVTSPQSPATFWRTNFKPQRILQGRTQSPFRDCLSPDRRFRPCSWRRLANVCQSPQQSDLADAAWKGQSQSVWQLRESLCKQFNSKTDLRANHFCSHLNFCRFRVQQLNRKIKTLEKSPWKCDQKQANSCQNHIKSRHQLGNPQFNPWPLLHFGTFQP